MPSTEISARNVDAPYACRLSIPATAGAAPTTANSGDDLRNEIDNNTNILSNDHHAGNQPELRQQRRQQHSSNPGSNNNSKYSRYFMPSNRNDKTTTTVTSTTEKDKTSSSSLSGCNCDGEGGGVDACKSTGTNKPSKLKCVSHSFTKKQHYQENSTSKKSLTPKQQRWADSQPYYRRLLSSTNAGLSSNFTATSSNKDNLDNYQEVSNNCNKLNSELLSQICQIHLMNRLNGVRFGNEALRLLAQKCSPTELHVNTCNLLRPSSRISNKYGEHNRKSKELTKNCQCRLNNSNAKDNKTESKSNKTTMSNISEQQQRLDWARKIFKGSKSHNQLFLRFLRLQL
ncbi:hypothetical protein GJ496_004657 [Pomphorhynchus laevis]|nr:hypothetical protein GJ496_004657 [Pomphorhynchus laevis]